MPEPAAEGDGRRRRADLPRRPRRHRLLRRCRATRRVGGADPDAVHGPEPRRARRRATHRDPPTTRSCSSRPACRARRQRRRQRRARPSSPAPSSCRRSPRSSSRRASSTASRSVQVTVDGEQLAWPDGNGEPPLGPLTVYDFTQPSVKSPTARRRRRPGLPRRLPPARAPTRRRASGEEDLGDVRDRGRMSTCPSGRPPRAGRARCRCRWSATIWPHAALVDGVDRRHAEPGRQHAVEGGRRAAALDVAEHHRRASRIRCARRSPGRSRRRCRRGARGRTGRSTLLGDGERARDRLGALGDHDDRGVAALVVAAVEVGAHLVDVERDLGDQHDAWRRRRCRRTSRSSRCGGPSPRPPSPGRGSRRWCAGGRSPRWRSARRCGTRTSCRCRRCRCRSSWARRRSGRPSSVASRRATLSDPLPPTTISASRPRSANVSCTSSTPSAVS